LPLSLTEETAIIELVRDTAKSEILPRFRALASNEVSTKSRQDDLVTIADRAAEKRIAEEARRIIPGVFIVGEEAVAENPSIRDAIGDEEKCLIIDPVDGTWNFAHGLATFGVILAFAERGVTTWGMIYDPIGDDWVVARAGEGAAFVRGDGVRTALTGQEDGSLTIESAMGYIHSYLFLGDERRRLFELLPDFHKTDALRCSAHEYRLLAQGAVDFCLSPVLNPWDHAAGALIASEIGGVARLLDGTPYTVTMKHGRLLVARSEEAWRTLAQKFSSL